METTFTFSHPVDEKHFIGRQSDVSVMKNLLLEGKSLAIYSEPKCGKMSIINKVLGALGHVGEDFLLVEIPFLRVRTVEDVLTIYASTLIKTVAGNSPGTIKDIVEKHLAGTHFAFDPETFISKGKVLSLSQNVDLNDAARVFALQGELAGESGKHIIILFTEFQNILFPEDSYHLLKTMEDACSKAGSHSSIIFTGTRFNAMREIFDIKKWFYGSVERFRLEPLSPGEIVNHYYRGFQQTGKVIEKEMIMDAALKLRCNMWYLSHLFCITDQMCHGYVNKTTMHEAFQALTSIHLSRFFATVCSLTDFQLQMLKAILDGETKFSASSVIAKYSLNSSANVKRLKDALIKKEIVWFDESDTPHIQDPLFELWLRNEYFK